MKKKREETFPKEQKMGTATNNLMPHLLAKVAVDRVSALLLQPGALQYES